MLIYTKERKKERNADAIQSKNDHLPSQRNCQNGRQLSDGFAVYI
jgi:hypothetical protein